MAAHSKLWNLERFHLLDALSDAQKRELQATTRMLEMKRGQHIYAPGEPSDEIFLLKPASSESPRSALIRKSESWRFSIPAISSESWRSSMPGRAAISRARTKTSCSAPWAATSCCG